MQPFRKVIGTVLLAMALSAAAPVNAGQNINFTYTPPASVGQSASLQWPQSTISASQLQSLFNQYPGVNQFHIQFPNNASWDVTPQGAQSMFDNYAQQAKAMGYNSLPNLNFSSLGANQLNANSLTVPISNMSGNMQQSFSSALQGLRSQGNGMMSSITDWIQQTGQNIWSFLQALYWSIHDKIVQVFR